MLWILRKLRKYFIWQFHVVLFVINGWSLYADIHFIHIWIILIHFHPWFIQHFQFLMDEFHSPLLTLIYNKYIKGCFKMFLGQWVLWKLLWKAFYARSQKFQWFEIWGTNIWEIFQNILSKHPSTIPNKFPIIWLSLNNSNDNLNQNPMVETILTILWMKFLVTIIKNEQVRINCFWS